MLKLYTYEGKNLAHTWYFRNGHKISIIEKLVHKHRAKKKKKLKMRKIKPFSSQQSTVICSQI